MNINHDTNKTNTIHITNYEVTTKITHHYLNHDIPMSRNSNTVSIKSQYASYVYYITLYTLIGLKNYQYYTHGEFIISSDEMYDLINELNHFVHDVCEEYSLNDSLTNLKYTIKKILLGQELEKIEDLEETDKIPKLEKIEDLEETNKTSKLEKIDNIYDEKDMFSDELSDDINNNIVKALS
jgi:hypothetical protein